MARSPVSKLLHWFTLNAHGRFFRDIGIVSAIRLSGGFLLFVTQIFLARWMDTGSFGIYSFAWTWVAVLGSLAGLGLTSTSIRFLATYYQVGDFDHMRGLVRHAFRATVSVSFAIALVAAAIFEFALSGSPFLPALRTAMLAIPVMAILNIDAAFARGMNWMSLATVAEQIGRPTLLLLIGAVMVAVSTERSATAFVLACLFAYFAVTAIQHIVVHKKLDRAMRTGPRKQDIRIWRKVATMQMLINGAQMLRMNGDPIVVGALLGPREVGIYIAAVRTATLVSFLLMITSVVAQPRFAAIHASGDRRALAAFFAVARRWTFLASLASASALAFAGKFILGLFGSDYIAAYPSLLILLAGHAMAAMLGPVTSMLVLIDRQYSAALILGTATLLNAVLTVLLAHPFGAVGAAVASSLSLVASYGALFLIVRGQFKYWPDMKDTTQKLGA